MPVYTIKMPDGGTLKMEGPAGASDAEIIAQAQKFIAQSRPSKNYAKPMMERFGASDALIHSATAGADTYAHGLAGALMNAIEAPLRSDVDFDPIGAFEETRKGSLDAAANYAKTHPKSSLGAGLAGFVLGAPGTIAKSAMVAPGILSRIAQGAKAGAGMGAITGFNDTRESIAEDPLSNVGNALTGGMVGGAIGAAIPVAGKYIASPIWNGVRQLWRKGEGLAAQRIAEALDDDLTSATQAGSLMDDARKLQIPRALADTGENTARLMGSVGRQPGQARTIVRQFLRDRQLGQQERLQGAITRDLGPVGNVADQSDAIMDRARKAAAPLYEKANSNLVPNTPELQSLLATPAGRAALKRAHTIAANERVNPTELGFALDADGNVILNPPNADMHGAIASAKANLDDVTQSLAKAQKAVLGGGGAAGDVPRLRDEAAKAHQAYEDAQAALNLSPTAGTAATQPVFTQRTLDYVKRGLDSVLEDSRDKVTGKLKLDDVGRSVEGVRKQFLRTVDALNPDYPPARAVFAGPASEADALRLGKEMVGASESDIARATREMSDSQKAQFALGMRSQLSENLSRRTDLGDKVSYLSNTPQRRSVLQSIAGPDADLERFQTALGHERALQDTYTMALPGSRTSTDLSDDAMLQDLDVAKTALGRFARGSRNGFWSGVSNAAAPLVNATRFGAGKTGERVRDQIAALLTETDPTVFQTAIESAQRDALKRRLIAGRLGVNLSGTIGGISGLGASKIGQ